MTNAPSLFEALAAPDARHDKGQKRQAAASPLRPDGQFRCMICGEPAHFGFGVKLRAGNLGRWSCREHIAQVKTRHN